MGDLVPRNWQEAIPLFVWIVLVLAFGFVFAESVGELIPNPIWRAFAALLAAVVLIAMLIHWPAIKKSMPLAYGFGVLVVAIALSPFVEQHRWPFSPAVPISIQQELAALRTLPAPTPSLEPISLKVEYIAGLQVSGPYDGKNTVLLVGRYKVTAPRIRIYLEYYNEYNSTYRQKTEIKEINDIVNGVDVRYPIVIFDKNDRSPSNYFWGEPSDRPLTPGISHARISIIGDDGKEQYYSFKIYLGQPRAEITDGVSHPGFIVKNEEVEQVWSQ